MASSTAAALADDLGRLAPAEVVVAAPSVPSGVGVSTYTHAFFTDHGVLAGADTGLVVASALCGGSAGRLPYTRCATTFC